MPNPQQIFLTLQLALFLVISGCTPTDTGPADTQKSDPAAILNPTNEVHLSKDIDWEQLNPARGDQSPQAGTLWGDRKGEVATGFLAKFVDGFASPPHIHNVTYRAVVVKGWIHNDDPAADTMWMKPGSFWTQPEGEAHITAAKGEENIAYVEIDRGPYLVKPTEEAFDNGERPVNIDATNVVWLGADKTNWVEAGNIAQISFLWESKTIPGLKGLFVRLPAGFKGTIETQGDVLRAIIIEGELAYTLPGADNETGETKTLDPGSHFTSKGRAVHVLANPSEKDVLIYIRTNSDIYITDGNRDE
ncbi:MAG: DUF4437 domain-containing protein [Bacteroidota bacterium]